MNDLWSKFKGVFIQPDPNAEVNQPVKTEQKAPPTTSKEDLEIMALADAKIKEYTDGKQIIKIIVVPSRLVNIVVK